MQTQSLYSPLPPDADFSDAACDDASFDDGSLGDASLDAASADPLLGGAAYGDPYGRDGGLGAATPQGVEGDLSRLRGGVAGELSGMLREIASMLPGLLGGGGSNAREAAFGREPSARGAYGGACGGFGGAEAGGAPGGERARPYASFDASSIGDPHDAFTGTERGGATRSQRWDDMRSHETLLDSPSIRGGYAVSATTTTPDAAGVTQNGVVDVRTSGGANDVRLDASGGASVVSGGRWRALKDGDALTLGDGTTVQDRGGAVTVGATNAAGGRIQTTMTANGAGGVDVRASGENVRVGGFLAEGRERPEAFGDAEAFARAA